MKTLVAVVLLLAACRPALAQQTGATDKDTNYRRLVAGLVSPNRPIKCDNGHRIISIPPNYDWKSQEQIERNRRELFDHCDEALPFLIEGCTDARYSLMSRWSEDDDFYSWSVGCVCSEIISRHVEAFRDQIRFSGPQDWHRYNFVPRPHGTMTKKDKREIQDWWRDRNRMSLRDLQLAAFDWAIEKRRKDIRGLSNAEDREKASSEVDRLISSRDKLKRGSSYLPGARMWPSLLSPPEGFTVTPWSDKE
jgi:hypothetical protein